MVSMFCKLEYQCKFFLHTQFQVLIWWFFAFFEIFWWVTRLIHFPCQMSEMAVGKSAHSMLQIMDIAEGDFGDYKCSASNILGVDDASLKLTGIPGQVSITSGTKKFCIGCNQLYKKKNFHWHDSISTLCMLLINYLFISALEQMALFPKYSDP